MLQHVNVPVRKDEKALNSKVGSACKLDYTVTFRDAQDLELIRRKLLKASLILKSNADVGRSLSMHVEKVARALQQNETQKSLELFNGYVANLEMHARTVNYLLERLSGTSKLVFHIFPFRIKAAHSLRWPAIPHARVPT